MSAALAVDMSSKMTMASGMDNAKPDLCPACGNPDGSTVAADCLPYCHLAGSMVLPSTMAPEDGYPTAFVVEPVLSPDGFVDCFDPSPPKISIHS